MNFNWKDKEQELKDEIKRLVKSHDEFLKSDIGQFLSQGDETYGNTWVAVLWWNGAKIECYDCADVDEAQKLIDFYHFSKSRTKVVISYSGKDVSEQIKFNSQR